MSEESLDINLEHRRIAMTGNALAVICLCSFLLMGFLMWRQDRTMASVDKRNEQTSSLRIEQCHQIQRDSVEVMRIVSKAMVDHSQAMQKMDSSIDELRSSVDRNTAKIEQLIMSK